MSSLSKWETWELLSSFTVCQQEYWLLWRNCTAFYITWSCFMPNGCLITDNSSCWIQWNWAELCVLTWLVSHVKKIIQHIRHASSTDDYWLQRGTRPCVTKLVHWRNIVQPCSQVVFDLVNAAGIFRCLTTQSNISQCLMTEICDKACYVILRLSCDMLLILVC